MAQQFDAHKATLTLFHEHMHSMFSGTMGSKERHDAFHAHLEDSSVDSIQKQPQWLRRIQSGTASPSRRTKRVRFALPPPPSSPVGIGLDGNNKKCFRVEMLQHVTMQQSDDKRNQLEYKSTFQQLDENSSSSSSFQQLDVNKSGTFQQLDENSSGTFQQLDVNNSSSAFQQLDENHGAARVDEESASLWFKRGKDSSLQQLIAQVGTMESIFGLALYVTTRLRLWRLRMYIVRLHQIFSNYVSGLNCLQIILDPNHIARTTEGTRTIDADRVQQPQHSWNQTYHSNSFPSHNSSSRGYGGYGSHIREQASYGDPWYLSS